MNIDSKIIDLININLTGGGENTNIMMIIIGLVILVIGIILLIIKNPWKHINAIIESNIFNNKNNIINISYIIDNKEYTKTLSQSTKIDTKYLSIYYDERNPNLIRFYNLNYKITGTILVIVGIFILINNFKDNIFFNNIKEKYENKIYDNIIEKENGIKIIYNK